MMLPVPLDYGFRVLSKVEEPQRKKRAGRVACALRMLELVLHLWDAEEQAISTRLRDALKVLLGSAVVRQQARPRAAGLNAVAEALLFVVTAERRVCHDDVVPRRPLVSPDSVAVFVLVVHVLETEFG